MLEIIPEQTFPIHHAFFLQFNDKKQSTKKRMTRWRTSSMPKMKWNMCEKNRSTNTQMNTDKKNGNMKPVSWMTFNMLMIWFDNTLRNVYNANEWKIKIISWSFWKPHSTTDLSYILSTPMKALSAHVRSHRFSKNWNIWDNYFPLWQPYTRLIRLSFIGNQPSTNLTYLSTYSALPYSSTISIPTLHPASLAHIFL